MRRLPLVAMFVLFIALCVSAAYWAMQLFRPPVRAVAAPTQIAKADLNAASGLFGGRPVAVAVAGNFQLKGVIVAGKANESIAILASDGKPAQAITVNKEAAPGVTVTEVHPQYILLSEGGGTKRVELPDSAKGQRPDVAVNAPAPAQQMQPSPAIPAVRGDNGQMPQPMPPQIPQQPPSAPMVPPEIPAPAIPGGGHPGSVMR